MMVSSAAHVSPLGSWDVTGSAVRGLTPTATLCRPLRGLVRAARFDWAVVAALLLCGCAGARPPEDSTTKPAPADPHAELRARALQTFANADLFKPKEGTAEGPIFELAPLIVEERPSAEATFFPDFPTSQPEGQHSAADPFQRTVFHMTSTAVLAGKHHDQITYLVPDIRPLSKVNGASRQLAWHVIRLTLDSSGCPTIYELFDDNYKWTRLFVSRSLERAATAEYGEPLPGRVSALERSVSDEPEVLVVRILEDGPVPMGPIAYVAGSERVVSTLVCRCMTSQAQNIVRTAYYQLLSSNRREFLSKGLLMRLWFPPLEAFPPDCYDPSRLERILRWPHGL